MSRAIPIALDIEGAYRIRELLPTGVRPRVSHQSLLPKRGVDRSSSMFERLSLKQRIKWASCLFETHEPSILRSGWKVLHLSKKDRIIRSGAMVRGYSPGGGGFVSIGGRGLLRGSSCLLARTVLISKRLAMAGNWSSTVFPSKPMSFETVPTRRTDPNRFGMFTSKRSNVDLVWLTRL
jgi:hypothetical protein